MSKKKKNRTGKKPAQKREEGNVGIITGDELFKDMLSSGYTRLDQNPEVMTCCAKIAELISSMTIHLMANQSNGDQRINNELSKHIDITPNRYMTRKTWMTAVVMNLILYGNGNSVVIPMTEGGLLGDLAVQPPYTVSFIDDGYGYKLSIAGQIFDPQDVLHFVYNPNKYRPWKGDGITAGLADVANNIKQARKTEQGFMESNWKPAVIVKADGLVDEFSDKEGRDKLAQQYLETNPGEPWIIPAELIQVETVKPLSLSDLAIKDTVELNKKTVASIIGVPTFLLGIGEYNESEWNNFISSKIRTIAQIIEQEMTKKILTSPKMYFKMNARSLYNYDIKKLAAVYGDMRAMGVVDGNEVRDQALGLSPREGLDELVMLENYIPTDKLGDQKKLEQGNE